MRVTMGVVYVDQWCHQFFRSCTHVVISHIVRLASEAGFTSTRSGEIVRMLLANANPDGSGVDLTGGVAVRDGVIAGGGDVRDGDGSAEQLWPNAEYKGVLELVHNLCQFWNQSKRKRSGEIVSRLDALRIDLIATLRGIRNYHRGLKAAVAEQMNVHVKELHSLVEGYVLEPLFNPSHLNHPLLD
jgi:hypothetical protein